MFEFCKSWVIAGMIIAAGSSFGIIAQDVDTVEHAGTVVPLEHIETIDTMEHVGAVDTVEHIEPVDRGIPYNGFGLSFGVTFFVPGQVNQMISDIYDDFKRGYTMLSEMGEPFMFTGESFKLKGVFYLNRHIALEPYGQAFWAGKWIFTSGAAEKNEWVHVLFYSGGINCWARFSPDKLVSFKAGAGGFGGFSNIIVTGDAGDVTLSGAGYGGNVLAGIDLTLGKVAVNVDFTVPIGVIKYTKRTGSLNIQTETSNIYGSSMPTAYRDYPGRIILTGFEIRPGVTFKF